MSAMNEALELAYTPGHGHHSNSRKPILRFRIYTVGGISTGSWYETPSGKLGKCVFVRGDKATLDFDGQRKVFDIAELQAQLRSKEST